MAHSKGNWKVGRYGSCVVTDDHSDFSPNTGHSGNEAVKYYGGALIAESIIKPDDAKLIAAAPTMLEALVFCKSVLLKNGIYDVSDRMAIDKAESAIKKATE